MADPEPRPRHGRRERVLLTLFFCLHFGAVLTYVAPTDADSLGGLPPGLREPLARVAPPLARRAWPVARPYLNLTATRQHWFLFSPSPAEWASSLDVLAYFPREGAEGGGSNGASGVGPSAVPGERAPDAASGASPGPVSTASARESGFDAGGAWAVDTLRVYGPREAPLPHWWDHRSFRVVFNMGYEGWGEFYRPYYARALCRRLEARRGVRPGGLELFAVWERTEIPWRDESGPELYHQDLGGYTCPAPEAGTEAS